MPKKILFTGAHHNSALALLDWMNKNSQDSLEFVWVGRQFAPGNKSAYTAEYNEVTARGIKFINLVTGKFYRFSNPKYFLIFLKNLFLIPIGFINAGKIMISEKPDLIVSFGGYIAVPVVIMGRILNIKCVTHEQTLVVGLANQIIYLFVDKIYTAWPVINYADEYKAKIEYVGLPLREKFLQQIASKEKFNFLEDSARSKAVIYITGGKNGSQLINEMVYGCLDVLLQNFNLIWACGTFKGDYDHAFLKQALNDRGLESNILLQEYFGEDEIGKVFNTADYVISRAGAHTVYELIYLQKHALLIPIPWASNNEQQKNAEVYAETGLGMILPEENLSPSVLAAKLIDLVQANVFKPESKIKVSENSSAEMGYDILQILKKTN